MMNLPAEAAEGHKAEKVSKAQGGPLQGEGCSTADSRSAHPFSQLGHRIGDWLNTLLHWEQETLNHMTSAAAISALEWCWCDRGGRSLLHWLSLMGNSLTGAAASLPVCRQMTFLCRLLDFLTRNVCRNRSTRLTHFTVCFNWLYFCPLLVLIRKTETLWF